MKQFKILVAAVAAVLIAVWFLSHREQQKFGAAEGALFLPELDRQLAEIDRLQVHAAGAEPVTLTLQDDRWLVAERNDYPAETEVLRRELRKLAETRVLEQKTAQAEYYARLGVADIDQAEDTTVRLVASAGGTPVLDLLIGKSDRRGSYVRRSGEAQSWLLDSRISLPREATAWLDKALLDVPRDQLQQISVSPLNGPQYHLSKADQDQDQFTLEPSPPEGRELDMANVNRLGAAVSRLRLQDVALTLPEALAWTTVRFQRFDGLELTVRSARQDSDRYLQLEASAPDDASEELVAEVQRINARAAGRSFAMAQHAVDAMHMSHEMLLKPLAGDEPSAG